MSQNVEFEVFKLGRKLYYALSKKEPYSAYDRFTNVLKNEKLEDIKILVTDTDEDIALMLNHILKYKRDRAVVFSELTSFISL